jgi:hypothetical protein
MGKPCLFKGLGKALIKSKTRSELSLTSGVCKGPREGVGPFPSHLAPLFKPSLGGWRSAQAQF